MLFKQYYLGCLAHASYLIGDETSATAVVVDPQRDIGQYLEDAASKGLTIRYVFLTHFHADFVAGHLELKERTGAEICLGKRAEAEYTYRAFADGEELDLGSVSLRVLETPGHTPESLSILVFDRAKDADHPHAVLTGDTLFIGDVGRPDLMASSGFSDTELASLLYDSLREKLMLLPDETLVYPAHGAGSLCGKNLSSETFSTIGAQKKYNYALAPMSREEFIRLVTADQPSAPRYFSYDALLNRKERKTLGQVLPVELTPLPLEEVLTLKKEGAQILDVRDPVDFEAAHLKGSLNIGLGGTFASWAGSLLDAAKPVVLVAEQGKEEEAATRLGRIGFDLVRGFLQGGMAALEKHPEWVGKTERITAAALAEKLQANEATVVLDVRSPMEVAQGTIPDSVNIPLRELPERFRELSKEKRMVVHCAGGYRSAIAASFLTKVGFRHVQDLVGGYAAWEKLPQDLLPPPGGYRKHKVSSA